MPGRGGEVSMDRCRQAKAQDGPGKGKKLCEDGCGCRVAGVSTGSGER